MNTNTKDTKVKEIKTKDKNTKDTKAKPDALVKIFLAVITVLLFVLVLKQALPQVLSEKCRMARQQAESSLALSLSFMDSYKKDVYGSGVSNINQQIFRVSEYQYLALEKIALYQQNLLSVITECQ